MMLSELSKSIARSVEVFPLFIHCNRDIEDKEMEYFIGALYDDKEYNHKYMVMTMMLMPVIMMMDIIFCGESDDTWVRTESFIPSSWPALSHERAGILGKSKSFYQTECCGNYDFYGCDFLKIFFQS